MKSRPRLFKKDRITVSKMKKGILYQACHNEDEIFYVWRQDKDQEHFGLFDKRGYYCYIYKNGKQIYFDNWLNRNLKVFKVPRTVIKGKIVFYNSFDFNPEVKRYQRVFNGN